MTLPNWVHTWTLGLFDTRTVQQETPQQGVLIDDEQGNENVYTELLTPEVVAKFDQMRRTDSELRALLRNIKLPIQAATFLIECEDEEVQAFCERQIGLSNEQNNINFQQVLRDALTYIDFGFYVSELGYALVDNRHIELTHMQLRPAKSIEKFLLEDGEVVGVVQQTTTKGEVTIPDRIFHLAFESEGNVPRGQASLNHVLRTTTARTTFCGMPASMPCGLRWVCPSFTIPKMNRWPSAKPIGRC